CRSARPGISGYGCTIVARRRRYPSSGYHWGVVFEKGGVKITAFEVDHPTIKPAFGYRIDRAGHSVNLSGDTRVSENLIRYAQGVDVLVHEVRTCRPERSVGPFFGRAGEKPLIVCAIGSFTQGGSRLSQSQSPSPFRPR